MSLTDFPYREIRIGDEPIFEKYLSRANRQSADYAFANLFAWSGFYGTLWREQEGFLVIRFRIDGSEKWAYLEPLGTGDRRKILEFIRQDAKSIGEPLCFFSLSPEFAESLQTMPESKSLRIYKNRDFGNYIYPKEQLAELAGKKFHSKRNHIERFQKLYPDFRFKEISTKEDFQSLNRLLDKWLRSQEKQTRTILEEKAMIEKSLANYRELELFGIILFVKENPVAFSFGSQVTRDTFCVHVEKADASYEGAYAMINQLLAKSLPETIQYINREEDMGIPGLRKAKLSYHPERITEEVFAYETGTVEADIWKLWQKSFPADGDEFLQAFLYRYSNEKTRITLYENGILASMLHLFQMESSWGNAGYIYGLATGEAFQQKGFASRLIAEALQKAKLNGTILVWTIPENRTFGGWKKFDFSEPQSEPLSFETEDGFTFGENPETDFGIFRILNMRAHLTRFAATHPEIRATFSVNDVLFPENSGTYTLEVGKLFHVPEISGEIQYFPKDVAALYPPSHGEQLVFVVPGQR